MLPTANISVVTEWTGDSVPRVQSILNLARDAALSGLVLNSSKQPGIVEIVHDFGAESPAIILTGRGGIATIRLTSGQTFWAQLCYQFLHELGHVIANSWEMTAIPRPPSMWIEEVLVEAFALRSLAPVADAWKITPPQDTDPLWFAHLVTYRDNTLATHLANAPGSEAWQSFAAYYADHAAAFSQHTKLDPIAMPIAAWLSKQLAIDTRSIGDLSALNLWPERSALPVDDYLARWLQNCRATDMPGRLPLLFQGAIVGRRNYGAMRA